MEIIDISEFFKIFPLAQASLQVICVMQQLVSVYEDFVAFSLHILGTQVDRGRLWPMDAAPMAYLTTFYHGVIFIKDYNDYFLFVRIICI